VTTCATQINDPLDPLDDEVECSIIQLSLDASNRPAKFTNVSKYLLYIYADLDENTDVDRVPLFETGYEDFFWNYDNNGLKLAQLRFYQCSTTVPDPSDPNGVQTDNLFLARVTGIHSGRRHGGVGACSDPSFFPGKQTVHKLLGMISVLLILFAPLQIALGGIEDGSLVVPERTHTFGTVKQGETITHSFVIRNTGSAPLKMARMELSEQGITARIKPMIPPGEEGQVTVRWDTGRVKGDVSGEVVLHFDDPMQSPIVLLLKGVVKPALEVLPSRAVFLSVFKGESIEQNVTIINNEERPFVITRLEPRGQHFLAELRAVNPGKVYELVVKVPQETPPGRYRETLDVHTDQPWRSPIKIAVNVIVKTELYFFPDSVDFGTVSLADLARTPSLIESITQTVLVKKRQGDFEIKSVTSDLPFFRIRQGPAGRSGTFRIDVSLDRDKLRPGKMQGSLRVRTDDTEFPELVVPA
jgi:hypothetical protein